MGLAWLVSMLSSGPMSGLCGQVWSLSHNQASALKLKAGPYNPYVVLPVSCHSIQNSTTIGYSYSEVFQLMNNFSVRYLYKLLTWVRFR